MTGTLLVLMVALPLVGAPICLLLRLPRLVQAWTTLLCWGSFGIAVRLLVAVRADGPISYEIGGWAPPWGIEYRLDLFGAFVALFVTLIGAAVVTWSPASVAREIPADRLTLFHAAYLLCLVGLLGIVVTGDLFNLFVFLEISSLSSYALISLGRRRRALTASFQYLVLGTIGATFVLIGIGFLLMITGSLNMLDVAQRLDGVPTSRTAVVAFAFLTVGLALKMALFPLHAWLPNAYTYAPSAVSAFLAATATKVSVYAMIRLITTVIGVDFTFGLPFSRLIMAAGLLAALFGSTAAIFQRDVKRLLAYSSIAQVGYMAVGLGFCSTGGLEASIVHLFNHALTKGALFLAVGCVALRLGDTHIESFHGLGRRMPLTMFLWVLGGLSLIGIPSTAGFVSKWMLIRGALAAGLWPVAVLLLFTSLLAVIYVWRVVEVAYFREPTDAEPVATVPPVMLAVTALLVAGAIWFGLDVSWSAAVAEEAAAELLRR